MTTRDSIQIDATELEQDQVQEEALTDGMALSFVDEMNTAFFGPSSNIAFTRHILRAMARSINQPKPPPTHRSSMSGGILDYSRAPSPTSPGEAAASKQKINVYELPPVAEMEEHIEIYFLNTGILFPFIHQPSFMRTYHEFKASSFTRIRQAWLGLLNIVMAMGCALGPSEDGSVRGPRAFSFYERAVALAAKPSVRGPNLDVVQYLLLASQYLQGTQKSSEFCSGAGGVQSGS
ncbi:uncharacterized protein LTR77_009579 [Saxophila tyrrhenica]|uniref:Xylanolytic transcriptional activator regulatory domain-containing protein n=1 Tax=Saxophila tyrrhenica TaxID=1690608 RepID=A0AAV9NYS7_9PEZI|nr:hypothetical protein LTR77_009579 [Saxophila tyrrhenica]